MVDFSATPVPRSDGYVPLVVTDTLAPMVATDTVCQDFDIVQFNSAMYVVEEDEGCLIADLMRIGKLKGPVRVKYKTEDCSAKHGHQYVAAEGEVLIEEGQGTAQVKIVILDNPEWNPTLEFKLHLFAPEGCNLGLYLKTARVKVIDTNRFPSDEFSEQIDAREEGIRTISDFRLFVAYFKLVFGMPGVTWPTLITLLLDQLRNLYLLLKLALHIYMIDTVFAMHHADTAADCILPGNRSGTAIVVGLLLLAPWAILHLWEVGKVRTDLLGTVTRRIQSSLFRKYLNYSESSRDKLGKAGIQIALLKQVDDIAKAYVTVLSVMQLLGRVGVLVSFALKQSPGVWWMLVLMAVIMYAFGRCRAPLQGELTTDVGAKEEKLHNHVNECIEKYPLIADYMQRPRMVEIFETKSQDLMKAQIPGDLVNRNNEFFTNWMAPAFIYIYIYLMAQSVVDGKQKLGSFLAVISILQTVSDDFGQVFRHVMEINANMPTLKDLTVCFNLPTDVSLWKKTIDDRQAATRVRRNEALSHSKSFYAQASPGEEVVPPCDTLTLDIIDLSFSYSSEGPRLFERVRKSVPQGQLVAVQGKERSGRGTFMKLLACRLFPTEGTVFFPLALSRALRLAGGVHPPPQPLGEFDLRLPRQRRPQTSGTNTEPAGHAEEGTGHVRDRAARLRQ